MSNYKAIATTTAIIRDIIDQSQQDVAGDCFVKVSPPVALSDPSKAVLNLFLYQVTPNAACNSFDLPTRNHKGELITKPVLALDLHYLLTASAENELQAQIMLSSAMIALNDNAIITKRQIKNATKHLTDENETDEGEGEGEGEGESEDEVADAGGDDFSGVKTLSEDEKLLIGTNLADQVESLKISLQVLSIEELTKLWSSFFQMGYRLSVAYKVSVVLLESELTPVSPSLPVSKRQLQVISMKPPVIEKIEPQTLAYGSSSELVIRGRNLCSDRVGVRFGGEVLKISDKTRLSENQISLTVPVGVSAGVKQVQVLQKIVFDSNDVHGHKIYESNIATFTLTPNITNLSTESIESGETLTLDVEPAVMADQKVVLLVGDYAVVVDSLKKSTNQLTVTIPDHIPGGTYLVRLRVDNATSLKQDGKQITITNNKS